MQRVPVKSTSIKSIGYDEKEKILEIEFHTNFVYQYFDVPVEVYEALVKAESKGKYYNINIKNKYQYAVKN